MNGNFRVLAALIAIPVLWPSALALGQCDNQITLVPLHATKAAGEARNFIRFRYSLSPSDTLLIRAHQDTETSIGPYDTGFEIKRDKQTIRNIALRDLPELRREEPDYSESFTALAVVRACAGESPVYFITMQYMGDLTSPALTFTLVPTAHGYDVSTLPMISGGIVDVSTSNPRHVRTWDNLHEGQCEACKTAYQITSYEIRGSKPIQIRKYRTKRLYQSGDFDDRRRIRFVP